MTDLKELIKYRCLLRGDFTLKSGQKSDYYIDLRKLTLSAQVMNVASALLYTLNYVEYDAIGGPSIGADPIVGATLAMSFDTNLRGFLIRETAKDHGVKELIIGSVQPSDRCVVIEDVVTTGSTLLRACKIIEDFGCRVVQTIAIVDRSDKGIEVPYPFKALFPIKELL